MLFRVVCLIWIATSVSWGQGSDPSVPEVLPSSVASNNIQLDCRFAGYPICCSALSKTGLKSGFDSLNNAVHHKLKHGGVCTTKKKYVSSPYEKRQYEMAVKINALATESERRDEYIKYFLSDTDMKESKIWLERVRIHGQSGAVPQPTNDDFEYMSRFEITKTCSVHHNGALVNETQTWLEWIEPLSMHARHPFAFSGCFNLGDTGYKMNRLYQSKGIHPLITTNTDYVLLQSGRSQLNHSTFQNGGIQKTAKYFLLDAGTSSFETSLYWFTCAYLQRGLAFDRLFGWEMQILEPNRFWSKVPPLLKPLYNFYNVPVQVSSDNPDSPLYVIKQLASEEDFVSFKLDIDTPSIEIPIVKAIASATSDVAHLIDEFFFELHFRCELMMHCGWGAKMNNTVEGLVLDRPHAMELFRQMRESGIRAHFWP